MKSWRYTFSPFLVGGLLLIYATVRGGLAYLESRASLDRAAQVIPTAIHLLRMFPAICLCVMAIVHGWHRGRACHPRLNPGYRQWLEMTPWQRGRPLLLGPAEPTPWDALLLVLLMALATFDVGAPWYWVPMAWSIGWVTATVLVLPPGNLARWLAGFTLPLLIYPGFNLWLAGPVLAVNLAVAIWALRQDLRAFPWSADQWLADPVQAHLDAAYLTVWFWPLNSCGPVQPRPRSRGIRRVLIPLLLGWWVTVALHLYSHHAAFDSQTTERRLEILAQSAGAIPEGQVGPLQLLAAVIALGRWARYSLGWQPPIRLLGRLRAGRWIVPGYDQIFIAPLLVLLTGCLLPWALLWVGTPVPWVHGATLAVLLIIALRMGPSYEKWSLTGLHHVSAAIRHGKIKPDDLRIDSGPMPPANASRRTCS